MIIARVFTGITNHFPVRASEWALAFMMVGWGFIVLQPDEMFAVVPAYSHMSMIASETAWGSATTCIGLIRIVALIANGTFAETWWGRWSPHLRAVLSFAACFLWASISLGLFASQVQNTGLAIYPFLFALDAYNCRRAAGDAGSLDGEKRGCD